MSDCLLPPLEIIAVNPGPQDLEIPPPGGHVCCGRRFNIERIFRDKVCNRHCLAMYRQAHDFSPSHNNTQPAGYQAKQVMLCGCNTLYVIKTCLHLES